MQRLLVSYILLALFWSWNFFWFSFWSHCKNLEQKRRHMINERLRILQELIPNGTKVSSYLLIVCNWMCQVYWFRFSRLTSAQCCRKQSSMSSFCICKSRCVFTYELKQINKYLKCQFHTSYLHWILHSQCASATSSVHPILLMHSSWALMKCGCMRPSPTKVLTSGSIWTPRTYVFRCYIMLEAFVPSLFCLFGESMAIWVIWKRTVMKYFVKLFLVIRCCSVC